MIFLSRRLAIRRVQTSCLLALLSLLTACAAPRTDLIESNAVDVDVVPASDSSIRYISVDATAQETVISGQVKRLGVYNNAFSGARVYAEAVYPDGSKHFEVDDLLQRTPRFRNFRMIYPDARFRIAFPERLPNGTTVHLEFAAPGTVQSASLREAS